MTRLMAVLVVVPFAAFAQFQFADPLTSATTGTQNGGQFVAQGGWQAGTQVKWDLGTVLTEGTFRVELLNWNPNSDSAQHGFDKQHILSMYEAPHGSPHQSDGDSPKTSFWQVRTGASYDNCFKFLSSTSGFDPLPAGRDEHRVTRPLGTIQPSVPHVIEVRWTRAGDVTVFLDGASAGTHSHGRPLRLRYVFVGTDNAPGGTYGPQADVIYKNVTVTGSSTVAPVDAGTPGGSATHFPAVADTWTELLNPATAHGSDGDLRTGGDGRTIFMRFDVPGTKQITSARLVMKAMNAGGGGEVHRVGDLSWTEAGLTHQGRPAVEATAITTMGRVEIDQEVSFDVSSAVRGPGQFAFAVSSTDPDGSGYLSRESGTPPELIVEWGPMNAGGGAAGGGAAGGGAAGGGLAAGGGSAPGGGTAPTAGGSAHGGGSAQAGGTAPVQAGGVASGGGTSAPVTGGGAAGGAPSAIDGHTGCAATGLEVSLLALGLALVSLRARRRP